VCFTTKECDKLKQKVPERNEILGFTKECNYFCDRLKQSLFLKMLMTSSKFHSNNILSNYSESSFHLQNVQSKSLARLNEQTPLQLTSNAEVINIDLLSLECVRDLDKHNLIC